MGRNRKPIPKKDRTASKALLKEALRDPAGQYHNMPVRKHTGYQMLNTANILTDDRYQRPVNEAKVRRIVKNFDENLVNPPKVSFRGGRYYVFDGQHTITALKIHNGGDVNVLCKVYYDLNYEQEVSLFVEQNGESTPVKMKEKLYAKLAAGDRDVTEMVNAVKEAGLIINWKSNTISDGNVNAVTSLWKAYKKLGIMTFACMLEDIQEAWGGEYDSLRGEILTGMSIFYKTYMGSFNQKRFVAKLSKVSPAMIIREGKLGGIGGNTGVSFARVILGIYNKGAKAKLFDRL